MIFSFKLWLQNFFIGLNCQHEFGYLNFEYVECNKCGKVKKDLELAVKFSADKWLSDIETEVRLSY